MSKEKTTKKAPAKLKKPDGAAEAPIAPEKVTLPEEAAATEAMIVETKPAKKTKKPAAKKSEGKKSAAEVKKSAAGAKKPASAKAAKPKAAKPPVVISNDDIALRAYFIAEKRRHHGLPGDETGDWVEAERQLRAEAEKAARASRSK